MNKRNGSATELLQRRVRLLGEKSPLFYDKPVHLVRGEGVWLYDADGKRYMDVYNNVPSVGHCHPHVVAALTRQAQTLNTHTRFLHETIVEYGERLTATLDESLSMAYFVCTGSEANELALRIARQNAGGMGIIGTNATYHGNTAALLDLDTIFSADVSMSPYTRTVPFPESYRPLHGLSGVALVDAYVAKVQAAIDAFAEDGIKFAGLLVCPIFANEGLPDVPPGYWAKVAKLVRSAGGLLIFDEVQSGFGRTGRMWGHESIGIVPDIITMGKPMGNGHPLAGVVSREEIVTKFQDDAMYFNTFGGNPVSCAVGLAVLDVIERENLIKNAARVGTYIANGLRELQEKYDLIGDVRGRGLFFGVELVLDRQAKTPAPREANSVVNMMEERGILINRIGPHNNILKMRPPLPFSCGNADQLLSTLDDILATLYCRQKRGFAVTRAKGQDAHTSPPHFACQPDYNLSSLKKNPYIEAEDGRCAPGRGDCTGCCAAWCSNRVRDVVKAGAGRVSYNGNGADVPADLASYIDHTLLKPEAAAGDIDRICDEAAQYNFAAVCFNPTWIRRAAGRLRGTGVGIASVVGFPLGASDRRIKAAEARQALRNGACEIDMVLNIGALKSRDYDLAQRDIRGVAEACREVGALCKVILETALLTDEEKVVASRLAKSAKAHFVKTSTGFAKGGATVFDVALMREAVGLTMGAPSAPAAASGGIAAGATRIGASAAVEIS